MEDSINQDLCKVRELITSCLSQTALRFLVSDYNDLVGMGKMLRSRLAFRVGPSVGVPEKILVHAAAAVEMVHAASLLHDDVIDGGYLRRGAPAFWVERGVSGAILLGDLLLFKSLDLLNEAGSSQLTTALIKFTGEVCDAESEQELVLRGNASNWENCINIARRKTGSLFAFTAFASAGEDPELGAALKEAGYCIGTAYQVADDILDINGSIDSAGKTLGTDQARKKNTSATVESSTENDQVQHIEHLCSKANELLKPWPNVRDAWDVYLTKDIQPSLDQCLACHTR